MSSTEKIVDCVLKTITINTLNWNASEGMPDWDNTKKAALSIDIGEYFPGDPYTAVSKSLYRSEPIPNVMNTSTAFTIPVTQKVVLSYDVVRSMNINLYGNDGSGNRLVYSSGFAGVGYSAHFLVSTRLFTIKSGFLGTELTLECEYQ